MNKPIDESTSARHEEQQQPAQPPYRAHLDETRWAKIEQNLKTIGGAVILALIIRTALFEAFEIEGPSMEPTLLEGDRVVVAKFLYGLFLPLRNQADLSWGSPDVGNVVIIKSPMDGVDIVKRVIGVAGDTIEMREDVVYRNGEPLARIDRGPCVMGFGAEVPGCHVYESQVGDHKFRISAARRSTDPAPVHVPEGHIYVLGDHRDSSNDSRNPAVGAIPITRVKGRVLDIYWSTGSQGFWAKGPEGFRKDRMFKSVE